MKKLFLSLLVCAGIGCAAAYAQQSKSGMTTEINANLPDNTVGQITPATVRQTLTDMVNSWQQFTSFGTTAANYTVQASDYGRAISVTSTVTITLPAVSGGNFSTFNVMFWNNSTSVVTITPAAPTTINGNASLTLNANQDSWVVSDGSNYQATVAGPGNLTGTASGNTTVFATTTGTLTNTHCVSIDGNGNFVDAGGTCTTGGGGGTVAAGAQYQFAYYTTAGTSTTVGGNSGVFTDAANDLFIKTGGLAVGTSAITQIAALSSVTQSLTSTVTLAWGYSSIMIGNTNTAAAGFAQAKTRGSTAATQVTVNNADVIASYFGYGSDGAAYQPGGAMRFVVDNTPAANSMPTRWTLATSASGSVVPTERMRVSSGGLVGIGTSVLSDVNGNVQLSVKGSNIDVGNFTDGTASFGIFVNSGFTNNNPANSPIQIGATSSHSLEINTNNTPAAMFSNIQETWLKNTKGEADIRFYAALSCNTASPSSVNVANGIYQASLAGYTHFFIPAGCYWDMTSVPVGSGWTARTIPDNFHIRGEDWTLSGIYCDTSHNCVMGNHTSIDNVFYVSSFCFGLDGGVFGNPAMCPVRHVNYTTSANIVVYPYQDYFIYSANFNIPAFGGNPAVNNWPDAGIWGAQNSSGGDTVFFSQSSGNSNNNLINGFANGGAVFVVKADGKTQIGNSSTGHAGNGIIHVQDATTTCDYFAGNTVWTCASDERLKTNVANTGDQIAWLNGFKIRDYTLKIDNSRHTGVIAQELQTTHPEMVRAGSDGNLQVDGPSQWQMIKAMQQMQAEIDDLKAQLAARK